MKNKALIYIAGLGVLVGLGYFGWKAYRKKHPKNETPPPPPITPGGETPPVNPMGSTPSVKPGGTTPSNYTTNPFKTKDELLAFQNWVISTKKDTSILGSAGADGLWGQKSASAWDKYGKDYLTSTTTNTNTSTSLPISVGNDIQLISSRTWTRGERKTDKWLTEKALTNNKVFNDQNLRWRDFIRAWAECVSKRSSDGRENVYTWFMFGGNVYDVYEGQKRMSNPIDKTAYSSRNDAVKRTAPKWDTSVSGSFSVDTRLGIVKNLVFNVLNDQVNGFYYIPVSPDGDTAYYQWIWTGSAYLK